MSAPAVSKKKEAADPDEAVNEVRLVGRVSQTPEERVLPSGDVLWTFRVVVPRATGPSGLASDGGRPGLRGLGRPGQAFGGQLGRG